MAINTSELLARICAIEEEATAAIGVTSKAVPRWLYQQEQTPYWRNRIGNVQLVTDASDDGQEFDVYRYTVETVLHYANASAGYNGEMDEAILAAFPQIIQVMDEREVLQSAAYPVGMAFLRYAYFQAGQGYLTLPYGAAGGVQIGSAFTWTIVFDKQILQAY